MSMPNDSNDSIEVTAATVDEAISQALERLGAREDDVAITVLSTPRSGLLGLGVRQARVRVIRRAPAAARSGVMSPPPAPPPRPHTPPVSKPSIAAPPRERGAQPRVAPAREPAAREPMAKAPMPNRPIDPPRSARGNISSDARDVQLEAREPDLPEAGGREDGRPTGDTKALVAEGRALLEKVLELMGEQAVVETVCDDDIEILELNIKSDGSGLLIGRHGQTLDALEYAVNRIMARRLKDAPPISIDTESYRARRRGQLHRMALARGEEAKREHQAVTLEPMPARDRRVVHLALKDDPLLTTRSAGEGFLRAIQIVPVDERRDSGTANRGRDPRRGREPHSERDQRREPDQRRGLDQRSLPDQRSVPDNDPLDDAPPPLGEQGGFRHGQKRIV